MVQIDSRGTGRNRILAEESAGHKNIRLPKDEWKKKKQKKTWIELLNAVQRIKAKQDTQ